MGNRSIPPRVFITHHEARVLFVLGKVASNLHEGAERLERTKHRNRGSGAKRSIGVYCRLLRRMDRVAPFGSGSWSITYPNTGLRTRSTLLDSPGFGISITRAHSYSHPPGNSFCTNPPARPPHHTIQPHMLPPLKCTLNPPPRFPAPHYRYRYYFSTRAQFLQ